MKVQPVGAVAAARESAAAQHLVHQVQQALADTDADAEHSLHVERLAAQNLVHHTQLELKNYAWCFGQMTGGVFEPSQTFDLIWNRKTTRGLF